MMNRTARNYLKNVSPIRAPRPSRAKENDMTNAANADTLELRAALLTEGFTDETNFAPYAHLDAYDAATQYLKDNPEGLAILEDCGWTHDTAHRSLTRLIREIRAVE